MNNYQEFVATYGKRPPDIVFAITRSDTLREVGKWLESTLSGELPDRLDIPWPVKVTALDILRLRESGRLPLTSDLVPSEGKKTSV